jgi:hypothetical protein
MANGREKQTDNSRLSVPCQKGETNPPKIFAVDKSQRKVLVSRICDAVHRFNEQQLLQVERFISEQIKFDV